MADELNLRPCPFCEKAGDIKYDKYYEMYFVDCTDGICMACTNDYKIKQDAIDAWNNRPIEYSLRADIEKLRDAIHYTLSNLEYMRMLWGGEGVTDGIAARLREALRTTDE